MKDVTDLAQSWLDAVAPNPYLQVVAVLLGIAVVVKLLDWLAVVVLRRLVRRFVGVGAERLAVTLHRPALITILLAGLVLTVTLLELPPGPTRVTRGILFTIIAFVWIFASIRFGTVALELVGRRDPKAGMMQPSLAPLLRTFLVVTLVLLGAYTILVIWGISVTALLASAGIVGLALSFAAQDTLGNLFAGIAILSDRPYQIGDYIVLDSGERGEVTHIGLRSTRLLTRDDVEVSIPNSVMGKAKIVNESGGPNTRYRLRVPVGVAYGSDIDQVMAILLRVAGRHNQVSATPEPRLRLRKFGDWKLEFELLCWIGDPAQRGLVLHELNCDIYRTFAEEGIRIPVPQQQVLIQSELGQSELPPGEPGQTDGQVQEQGRLS